LEIRYTGPSKQAEELQLKSDEYARVIMASPITRAANWMAYHAIYLSRLTFALPASYLSAERLTKIEQ
jgi:hypothetical protein